MVVHIDTTFVRGRLSSYKISLFRPAFGDEYIALIVNPSHVVVNLPVDKDVIVGGWHRTFEALGQRSCPRLGCVVGTRRESEFPQTIEAHKLSERVLLRFELDQGLLNLCRIVYLIQTGCRDT
jgi:hypothetical protein